jgi:hypothetical protein
MSGREKSDVRQDSARTGKSGQEMRDLEVKSGLADVKGGRPVKKGGDPEDGGE